MKNNKKTFVDKFYSDIMPAVYGLGAAVVIVGAMFKLLNLSGASVMLAVGLTTEAILFTLGIFEPKEKSYDWSLVYPELDGGKSIVKKEIEDPSISKKLDEIFAEAKFDVSLLEKLKSSMENFSQSASGMSDLSSLSDVTSQYITNITKVSESLEYISSSAEKVSAVIANFGEVGNNSSSISATLSSLNSLYKEELDYVEKRVSAMKDSTNSYTDISSSIKEADQGVVSIKDDLSSLKSKLEELNGVYGKMLSAIKG